MNMRETLIAAATKWMHTNYTNPFDDRFYERLGLIVDCLIDIVPEHFPAPTAETPPSPVINEG